MLLKLLKKEDISKGRVYELDRAIFRKITVHKGRLFLDQNGISADTRISDVVPSARICRALQRSGIDTIGDLYALKDDDLLKVRNLGKKGINELKKYLDEVEGTVGQIPV